MIDLWEGEWRWREGGGEVKEGGVEGEGGRGWGR